MIIDKVYRLIQFISNKEQRGNITPEQFNVIAESAQLRFISMRLGTTQAINRGVPQPGYEQSWRIHEDLRPFVYGPVTIPIDTKGDFNYPYGYLWTDSVSKTDYKEMRRLTADQYPRIKHSRIVGPTPDYPIIIFRNPYGYIDPYSIGSFLMSYVKSPNAPVWGYTVLNDEPVFNEGTSVDFQIPPLAWTEIAMYCCQHVGLNLNLPQITQYGMEAGIQGT